MNTVETIEKYFGDLDTSIPTPIYKQLEAKAMTFVNMHPTNTLFPSERDLAAVLKINRRTVTRALEPLIANNFLQRTPKGTFINKPEPDIIDEEIHPLNFAMGMPLPVFKRKLRILLFENMPPQIDFWRETVADFNTITDSTEAELHWLSSKDFKVEKIIDSLAESDYDILQLPVSRIWPPGTPERFLQPSKRITEYFDKASYRIRKSCETYPAILDGAIPYAAGFRFITCNVTLLRSLGISNPPSDFEQFMPMASSLRFPEGTFLIDHITNISSLLGFRLSATQEHMKKYISELLRFFPNTDFASTKKFETPTWEHGTYSLKEFLAGNALLAVNGSIPVNHHIAKCAFETRHFLPPPMDGSFNQLGCNLFGINKKSCNTQTAEDFIIHLLSEKVQKRLASMSIPMFTGADNILASTLNLPEPELKRYIASGRELPYFHDSFNVLKYLHLIGSDRSENALLKLIELLTKKQWSMIND